MNMFPSFTTLRDDASYRFSNLRMRASWRRFWDKLTGVESALAVFPGQKNRLTPNRKLIGIKNIRVAEIVGTLNREGDFDSQFRPLKKHDADRWINMYILHRQDSWSPIIVHKVGAKYFVEDGHHRVSVARAVGMDFIEARVWEYSVESKPAETCQRATCMEKRPSKVYVTG
jgi:hypothetical protein